MPGDASSFTVVTLNLRHMADRWPERLPLVRDELLRFSPEVVALQEVDIIRCQARRLARAVNARLPVGTPRYRTFVAPKAGWRSLLEGIAILSRLPVIQYERIDLHSGSRVAQRARLSLGKGQCVDLYNTHLHHAGDAHAVRCEQALRLLGCVERHPRVPALITGDLNARPDSPPATALLMRLQSAYAAVHGHEPERTVPAPLAPRWPHGPAVIDYILFSPPLEPVDARVVFDRPHPADPRLSPSDHYGVLATFRLRTAPVPSPLADVLSHANDRP